MASDQFLEKNALALRSPNDQVSSTAGAEYGLHQGKLVPFAILRGHGRESDRHLHLLPQHAHQMINFDVRRSGRRWRLR